MFARTFKKDNSTKNKSKIDENSRSLDIKLSFLRYIDIKKNIKGNNIKNVKSIGNIILLEQDLHKNSKGCENKKIVYLPQI